MCPQAGELPRFSRQCFGKEIQAPQGTGGDSVPAVKRCAPGVGAELCSGLLISQAGWDRSFGLGLKPRSGADLAPAGLPCPARWHGPAGAGRSSCWGSSCRAQGAGLEQDPERASRAEVSFGDFGDVLSPAGPAGGDLRK